SILSLEALTKTLPWLARLANRNEILKGFIQGTLPTLLVQSFNFLLPKTMRSFSGLQGFHARSVIELSTFAKYYFFLLVNVLLIFSIAGTIAKIFKEIEEIIKDPTKIPYLLATTLPLVSNFFVNLVILQGIGLFPVQLLQGPEIFSAWFTRTFLARTPREYAEANAPPFLDYGQRLPPIILVFVVILVYSSITPLILLFGTIYFFFGYMTHKYLLLYVYFHPYETAGLAWPKIFHRIIVGLYIYQIMMIGYMSLRKSYVMAGSLTPIPIITAIFYYYVNEAYNRSAAFIPLKTLREEENRSASKVDDVNLAPVPPTLVENEETLHHNQVSPPQRKDFHSRRTLDNDIYRATPDFYTDYSQPPITLHDGVLDTGIRNYGAPELYGVLPWLWLPVKGTDLKRAKHFKFFGQLLGMDSGNARSVEESVPLLGPNYSTESIIVGDSGNRLRNSLESIHSEINVASGSGENEQIIGSPSGERIITEVQDEQRLSSIADKLGEFAGKNFD
ncbi:15301_t:CDS:2, partial [Acaulospora morrowiae]